MRMLVFGVSVVLLLGRRNMVDTSYFWGKMEFNGVNYCGNNAVNVL